MRRILLTFMVVGLAMASGVSTAAANPGASHEKVFVCKYVGKPMVDERLQTGNNPIDVSTSSIKVFNGLGSYFADAQGQSFVLAWSGKGVQKPPVTDCPAPRGPGPVVTSQHTTSCLAYRIRTITTPFVLEGRSWVPGEPVLGEWMTSTPTSDQLKDAHLDCRPGQPRAEVEVTSEHVISCDHYRVRDTTVTTPYVWKEQTQTWQLGAAGEPVLGEWVTSTPTADQLKDAGLDCRVEEPVDEEEVPPVTVEKVTVTVTQKATKPASAAASVLGVTATMGVTATANPLPAAAHAGAADTSGQLAAGELTGLAALLAFGAAFVLRRRRGVV